MTLIIQSMACVQGTYWTKTTIDQIASVPLRPKLLNKIYATEMRCEA